MFMYNLQDIQSSAIAATARYRFALHPLINLRRVYPTPDELR